jgi:hypothetical protein
MEETHPPCECSSPTPSCRTYGWMKGQKWNICQGPPSAKRDAYLTRWTLKTVASSMPSRHVPQLVHKEYEALSAQSVGTELKQILTSLGFSNCGGCAAYTLQMDRWGIAGCKEKYGEILTHLRAEQRKRGWLSLIAASVAAVRTGIAFRLDPLDPAPGLLDEALRRAEAKVTPVDVPPSPGKVVVTTVWSYGVTTCRERLGTLLPETLESLEKSGFPEPRLFADGCMEHDLDAHALTHLEHTCRFPAVQVAGNLTLALWELYHRDPHADRYAVFQDDCLASVGLREYLEACEYPSQGYWSLYTSKENHDRCEKEYYGWYESNQLGKGAVGLVFDKTSLLTLLGSPELLGRPQDTRRGHKAIDGGIVHALSKAGWKEYVHNPSLLQHTGVESVQNPLRHKNRRMVAPNWVGDLKRTDTETVSAIMTRLRAK